MEVKRYSSSLKDEWNEFINEANNATFLFKRDFMDYHSDRFEDYSLMVYSKGKLFCCFPANVTKDNIVYSHQGLTYGAFCMKPELKLPVQLEIYKSILEYLSINGISKLFYKAFPRFYNKLQTDEIEYALFRTEAKLYRKDTAIAVDKFLNIKYSGNIRREAKKAKKIDVVVNEDSDFKSFWLNVLTPNLQKRFGVDPVHSVEEILLLKTKFPDQIKLYTAKDNSGKVLAGTVFFIAEHVAHCQYISASDYGRNTGALNLLFTTLLDDYFEDKRFVDFGIVNENDGRSINIGMLGWKERLGGRTYSHDFYEVDTINFNMIK